MDGLKGGGGGMGGGREREPQDIDSLLLLGGSSGFLSSHCCFGGVCVLGFLFVVGHRQGQKKRSVEKIDKGVYLFSKN